MASAASLSPLNGPGTGLQQEFAGELNPENNQEHKQQNINNIFAAKVTFLDLYVSYIKAKARSNKANRGSASEKKILKDLLINEKYLLKDMIDEYGMASAFESLMELKVLINETDEQLNDLFVNDTSFLVSSRNLNGQPTNLSHSEIINGSFNTTQSIELQNILNYIYGFQEIFRNNGMPSTERPKVGKRLKEAYSTGSTPNVEEYKSQLLWLFYIFDFVFSEKIIIVIVLLLFIDFFSPRRLKNKQ